MAEKKPAYTIQVVDKAMDILEILSDCDDDVTLQNLSERVGLSRGKTFRLLSTLCYRGLAEKDAKTGAFHLGVSAVPLAQKFMKSASVTSYAHPIIEDLARRHDEAVYMTVINNGDVLFVDMVDCKHHVKATTFVGKRFPFFTNAAGKVMKALDSWDLLEKMLKKYRPLNAVPNLDELKSELCEIRLNGVAIDREALGEGIISVAVAVRDYAGKVVGAITLLGPSFRMLSERLESEIIPSLLEGAELLSAKYGYAPAK